MGRALRTVIGILGLALLALSIWDQLVRDPKYRTWHGDVFGIPYDLRPPTMKRARQLLWAPENPRLWGPHIFGVGWSLNVGRIVHEARRLSRD